MVFTTVPLNEVTDLTESSMEIIQPLFHKIENLHFWKKHFHLKDTATR